MIISLRTADGWAKFKHNQSKTNCDWDRAKLWLSPAGKPYCDKVHEITVNANPSGDDCPRCGMPNVIYWCKDCEIINESNQCESCEATLRVDRQYHKGCS